jgi:hypothetical protein
LFVSKGHLEPMSSPHVGKHYQFIPSIQNDGPFAFIFDLVKDLCKLFMKMKYFRRIVDGSFWRTCLVKDLKR